MGGASDEPDISKRKRFWPDKSPFGRSAKIPTGGPLPTYDQPASNLNSSEKTITNNGLQAGSSANSDNEKRNVLPDGAADATQTVTSPPASPPQQSEQDTSSDSPVNKPKTKGSLNSRLFAGIKRFGVHTKDALFHSWVNVLLVFVPVGIVVKVVNLSPGLVFGINCIAIIPLAGLLVYATESVASRLGDTLGALLNVSFGNAVELILFIIALTKNEIRIVQASLLGSILSNLLLILGMAFLLGGLRFQEQVYNNTVTQMSACLLSLSVISLLLPTAFHASFSDTKDADVNTLKISRATSVVLLIIYVLYLLFQLKSHSYLYESTPQHIIDEESHPGILADTVSRQPSGLPNVADANAGTTDENDGEAAEEEVMSRTAATVLLLVSTALVAVCAEFLVGAIPGMLDNSPVSEEFIGLIVLPIVSNAAEHLTAVTVAAKNKMDLAIGVSVGSSIQISLFVTPLVVILGWIIGRDMTLYFSLFETVCLFVTVFVVNFLVLDGRSNYLEGSLLMAAYMIIAVSAYYFPDVDSQS
ncbi:calcium/proton exchanger, partial [Myriangium duriaei CBS 260.36]